MADLVHLPGATKVYVDHDGSTTSNTYHLLGYTINGVEITHETFMSDVPGDQNGGDEGPPIEFNKGSKFARLMLEFECHQSNGVLWNQTTPTLATA